jgi:hypothetical protein
VYPRAELAASRVITSRLLTKARDTESFWVLVEFALRDRMEPTIGACYLFFTLRDTPRDDTGACGQFYALVRLYKCHPYKSGGKVLYQVVDG